MLVKMAATSYVGDHRFCRISRQSSPFAYTFGWNILDLPRVRRIKQVAASGGVSLGGRHPIDGCAYRNLTVGGLFG